MHDDCAATLLRGARGMYAGSFFAMSAFLAACAGATVTHTGDVYARPMDPPDRSVRWYDVIGADEIRATPFETAYEAVRKLRPRYLTSRYADVDVLGGVPPVAVIDGGMPEPIDVLKQISADAVAEIRFIEGADAVTRFGVR